MPLRRLRGRGGPRDNQRPVGTVTRHESRKTDPAGTRAGYTAATALGAVSTSCKISPERRVNQLTVQSMRISWPGDLRKERVEDSPSSPRSKPPRAGAEDDLASGLGRRFSLTFGRKHASNP